MTGSGNNEAKIEMLKPITSHLGYTADVKLVPMKKKATFELDAELHRWFKGYCIGKDIYMAEKIEELLREYRREITMES